MRSALRTLTSKNELGIRPEIAFMFNENNGLKVVL